MRAAAVVAAAVLLLPVAGCGADEDEVPPPVGLRAAAGSHAPGAAAVFERFVDAARRGDAVEMWGLLSAPTRASLGPTLPRFRESAAIELQQAAGEFAGGAELALARAFGPRWAVAVATGVIEREGEREPAAFAAALRREPSGWRLELHGIFFVGHQPSPLEEVGNEPTLGATAQSSARIERMVLWLDGEAVGARATRPQPFTGTITARAAVPLGPGIHVVTVFAATDETAAAQAWPFEVEGR